MNDILTGKLNRASNVHFESPSTIDFRARSTVKAEEAKGASEAGIESDSAPTAEEDRQGRDYMNVPYLYRVTHLVGENLSLTQFQQFWQLVGRYCSYLIHRLDDGTPKTQVNWRFSVRKLAQCDTRRVPAMTLLPYFASATSLCNITHS